MLSTPEFAEFARDVVPLLHVTTQLEGVAHDDLLRAKGRSGFPTLLIMDATGRVVAEPGSRSVAAFVAAVAGAQARVASKQARDAAAQYLLSRTLGAFTDPALDRAAFAKHRAALKPEERARIERELTTAELRAAVAAADLNSVAPGAVLAGPFQEACLRLLAARDGAGGWPEAAVSRDALLVLLAWADARGDGLAFGRWLEELRALRGAAEPDAALASWCADRLDALVRGDAEADFVTALRAVRGG